MLHCYRNDPAFVPELDFVMELGSELIGQVIYVRAEIECDDGRTLPIMTFGPISIAPAYKRQGYGKQLLDYSMEKAREMGAGALAITGNIDFYGKSGFVPAKTKGVKRRTSCVYADLLLLSEELSRLQIASIQADIQWTTCNVGFHAVPGLSNCTASVQLSYRRIRRYLVCAA